MKEDIVSFVDNSSDEYAFFVEMAGISYCDGTYRINRKNSPIYVFEYVLKGQGTVVTEAEEFVPVKGDVYILHRQSNHMYYSDDKNPWTKIWFNARGPLIDSLMHVYKLSGVNHIKGIDISELFFKMYNIGQKHLESDSDVNNEMSIVFYEIILAINKFLHKTHIVNSPEAIAIKSYLDKNIMRNVALKELSELIYRSPSQTIRIFKNEFNVTPYNYLMNKKMEIAKLMLLNTNRSIKEISLSLSFTDEHYFSNYFKSKIGVSPLKFRLSNSYK